MRLTNSQVPLFSLSCLLHIIIESLLTRYMRCLLLNASNFFPLLTFSYSFDF